MNPRRLALAGAALACLAFAAPARAGTFTVSQCNAASGGRGAAGVQADLWSVSGERMLATCGSAVPGALSFYTPDYRLAVNATARAELALPASMPHAALRAVWLDWRSLPSAGPAFASIDSGGAVLLAAPSGVGTPPGTAQRLAVPAGARSLGLATWCSPVHGPGWCTWSGPLLEVRGFTAEVEDPVDPAGSASGALLAAGVHAGVEPVTLSASDADSGVRSAVLTLAGVPVATVTAACRADRLPPCPQQLARLVDVDTSPISDGTWRAQLTVTDAAGNRSTADLGLVDLHSQAATVLPPPGAPPANRPPAPFPPNPLAGEGHAPNGHPASARARVRAWLEWRGRRRRAVTVPPGVRVRIRGRVTDPHGRGIAGAALALVETYGGRRRAATGVRTRPDGRFTAFARVGPSRTLRYAYYPYGDSRRARLGPLLRVRVRR